MNIHQEKTPVNQSSVFYLLPGQGQDEISLLDVLQALGGQWKFIFAVMLLVTLTALTVGVIMPTLYRAEANLLSPSLSSVELLNIPEIYEISMEDFYKSMVRNLKSKKLRRDFFEKHSLFEKLKGKEKDGVTIQDVFRIKFDEMLVVKQDSEEDPVIITLDGEDPQQIRLWLDKFIDMVNGVTVQAVVDTINARVQGKLNVLRNKVQSLRVAAEKYQEDRLTLLEENLLLAQKLNANKQQEKTISLVSAFRKDLDGTNKLRKIDIDGYLIGKEAIMGEIEKLKRRKNIDPFIPGLRDLQGEIYFLENMDLHYKNINAARIDQPAEVLDKPVKPNLKLIVAIGIILGGIVAVSLSLFRTLVYKALK